jgi:hypothetical protein
MNRLLKATVVIGLLAAFIGSLSAQEPKAPSLPSGTIQPSGPSLSPPTPSAAALMGLLGALPKPGATPASAPQVAYPIFQVFGPIATSDGSANPETMGNLLLLQGELMIKMGEVLMKYGQLMLEKGK